MISQHIPPRGYKYQRSPDALGCSLRAGSVSKTLLDWIAMAVGNKASTRRLAKERRPFMVRVAIGGQDKIAEKN